MLSCCFCNYFNYPFWWVFGSAGWVWAPTGQVHQLRPARPPSGLRPHSEGTWGRVASTPPSVVITKECLVLGK